AGPPCVSRPPPRERRDVFSPPPSLPPPAGCAAPGRRSGATLMLMEIVLDRATPLDAGLVTALHKSCFPRPWDEAAMATFIASPDTLCLLGSINDDTERAPAGFLIARKAADEAELLTLAVAPGRRGGGLGRGPLI